MNSSDLLTYLQKTYLFENIAEEVLKTVSANLELISLSEGETLFQQGDTSDALYIITKGILKATLTQETGSQVVLGEMGTGEIVGEIQILIGGKRTASVSAISDAELLKWPRIAIENLVVQSPNLFKKIAALITRRLRRDQLRAVLLNLFGSSDKTILEKIENQIEWIFLQSGEALFRQGEPGESLYIVISGRLQAVLEDEAGNKQILNEISQGESIGEMAIITNEPRSASVYALRDCELVKLSSTTFDQIIQQDPPMMRAITQVIINRLRQKGSQTASVPSTAVNIAIIPVNPEVSLTDFCERLVAALSVFDATLHLSSERLDNLMGMSSAAQLSKDNPQSIRLGALLDGQESQYRFILYESDKTATSWTKSCLRRADQIILVADATASATLGDIEKTLLNEPHRISIASQLLVLLHPDDQKLPFGTQQGLSVRSVKNHHHIRWDHEPDFERLARFISGRAIGLVLGGGGARGFAHFGVFLAFKELGIPIDMIGGTSMGAIVGAQCAANWDKDTFLRINKKGVRKSPFKAYTLPLISLTSSKRVNALLKMGIGEIQIEDLWTNFFCVSSNLTTSEMVIHRQGHLRNALKASGAAPGILEPVKTGHDLLVDGGILNNLPGDIMREFCSTVIVVDVSGKQDLTLDYDTVPSPWELLWSRIWPFKQAIQTPSILDILMASTLLSSTQKTNKVKADADLYLRPPVDSFGLFEVTALEELVELGYQYGKAELEKWQQSRLSR